MLVRTRILGSVPLTVGSGSCFFRQWPWRRQQKIFFFFKFSCQFRIQLLAQLGWRQTVSVYYRSLALSSLRKNKFEVIISICKLAVRAFSKSLFRRRRFCSLKIFDFELLSFLRLYQYWKTGSKKLTGIIVILIRRWAVWRRGTGGGGRCGGGGGQRSRSRAPFFTSGPR